MMSTQSTRHTTSNTVYLVACASKKRVDRCRARDLYISHWFLKARDFVESKRCTWFILSAKYGLVAPDQIVAPYEQTLNTMSKKQREEWAAQVITQMKAILPDAERYVVLAGQHYREFLIDYLQRRAQTVEIPLQGLGIGEQLHFLQEAVRHERM